MQSKHWFLVLLVIESIVATAGCSGSEPKLPSEEAASGSTVGSGGAGGVAGHGGAGGGHGGHGGAGGKGGAGDLLPLAVGYEWAYDIAQLGAKDTCGDPDVKTAVLKATTIDGKDGFEVDYFCSNPIVLRSEGDLVEFNQGGGWKTLLAPPILEGASWTCYDTSKCTWKSAGIVTVPAGTFSDCWTVIVDFMNGEARERTYCRGVGHVTSHYKATDGNGYDAKLVSISF